MARNSVKTMVHKLILNGPMTENQLNKSAFGFVRNQFNGGSNKKYADMLRRGMAKGIIDRVELPKNKSTRSSFMYFTTTQEEQERIAEETFQRNKRSVHAYYEAYPEEEIKPEYMKYFEVPCSAELDMEMANESENIQ